MKKESFVHIVIAMLLTFCGGFCDAYTFITRGGVFASMQTGNLINLFVNLIDKQTFEWMFFLPIIFFILGCVITVLSQKWKHEYILTLVLLFASFLGCGFCPQNDGWNLVCVCILSVTGAMQFQAFRHCMDYYYTSTMCTNNMRLFSESIVERNKGKILFYLSVIIMFSIGCVVGVVLSKEMGIYSLCPFSSIYLIILIIEIMMRTKKRELESQLA